MRLWQQATYTCNNVIEMMYGFTLMGVTGDQLLQLRRLSARLNEVIQNCEVRTHVDSSSP